jgi:hypothetical protein
MLTVGFIDGVSCTGGPKPKREALCMVVDVTQVEKQYLECTEMWTELLARIKTSSHRYLSAKLASTHAFVIEIATRGGRWC